MLAPTAASDRQRLVLGIVLLGVTFLIHAGLMRVGWNASGLIGHEFRQTQTAISCYFTMLDGYKLDYPTPVLGKPWSAPMEFPLYQWATAAWANGTGQPIYKACRWVSILSFYAAIPALILLLLRAGLRGYQACIAVTFILASPLYIFFTRAVLIESMAICTSAWALWFVLQCVDGKPRLWIWLLGAWIMGAAAILVKITTWTVWMYPAIVLTAWALFQAWRAPVRSWAQLSSIAGRALLATIPVFIVGILWTRYADAVKAENPGAMFLQSKNLNEWNFGTLAMRFDGKFWASVWRNVTQTQVAAPLLLACIPVIFLQARGWRIALLLVGAFVAAIMTFTNLYFLHDYYYYSNAIFLVATCGVLAALLFETVRVPLWAAATFVVLGLGLQYSAYYRDYFQTQRIDFYGGNGLTQALKALSGKDDVMIIYGDDWASMIPYYSERRTLMIPGWREHDEESIKKSIKLLEGEKVMFLLMRGNARAMLHAIEARNRDLDINPHIIFSHEPTGIDVYVRNSDAERVARAIAVGRYHGVKLRVSSPDLPRVGGHRNQLTGVTEEVRAAFFPMMTPAPKLYQIPYDLGVYTSAAGKLQFGAHAGTDLIFDIPAGATEVSGTFGMLEGSYTEGTTKGVEFEVLVRKPDTPDLSIYKLFLEPRFTPADRGPKNFKVTIPAGYAGKEVVFKAKPGPDGDGSYGWGYIEKLLIK